jgi:hypothetical protein
MDVINIRQSFLNIRDDDVDPIDYVKLRRLRRFPFLTDDDLSMIIKTNQNTLFDPNSDNTSNQQAKDQNQYLKLEESDGDDDQHSSNSANVNQAERSNSAQLSHNSSVRGISRAGF